jgi:hypothetical protein
MGQPNRISPANVLPFPRGRVTEDDSSQARESQAEDYHVGGIKGPARLAPQRHRVFEGFSLIRLHRDDRRATLHGLKRPYIVSSSDLRVLVIALVLLAVLPSLSVATMVWLRQTDIAPSMDASSNRGAVTETVIALPSISTPTMLKATPGQNTPFPIAIDGTDPVTGGGTITISRLPVGSTLSAGVPHDETTWKVAPGQIDNLHLLLPEAAPNETALLIQLLASDGHVISDAATFIEVATVRGATIPVRRVKTEVVAGHVWDQADLASEAMETEAEPVGEAMALQSDVVQLPTKRPGPRQ